MSFDPNNPINLSSIIAKEMKFPEIKSPAEYFFDGLKKELRKFQANLDENSEVAIRAISDPFGRVIHIRSIELGGGGSIVFRGETEDFEKSVVIQHFTQVNILFQAAKKLAKEANPIGFIHPKGGDSGDAE